jgi:hypothetical protein
MLPVNTHEECMREACYARCGDRDRSLRGNRKEELCDGAVEGHSSG